ncbi:MAG: FctA domain-containing protein [Lachnospiraceae bacterium]|nr:FctA domain-containing protein [Lachnospiraceae bacterium]
MKMLISSGRTGLRNTILLPILLLVFLPGLLLYTQTVYAAAPVSVVLPVSCSGGNPLEAFTVVLDMESAEFQTADRLYLQLKADGEDAFTIQYSYPGTYRYKIHQEAGNDKTTTYDSTVYQVSVFVTEDEQGTLHAEPVLYTEGSSEKKAELSFRNSAETGASKNSSRTASAVQTGDHSMLLLYAGLLLGSAVIVTALIRISIRERKG